MQKILTILRHAKTEAGTSNQDDQQRKLVERGREATKIVGEHMVKRNLFPDMVLCSTAIRTTETLLGIEHVYGRPLPVKYEEALYLASANEMIEIMARVSFEVNQLVVIGHNPGVQELCMRLAQSGDEGMIEKMAIKFPTCAMATFKCYMDDWESLRNARSELVEFVSPKMLGQVIP